MNLQGLNLLFSGHWCRDHNGTNIDLQNPVRYVQHGALYTCIMYIVYYALCSSNSSSSSTVVVEVVVVVVVVVLVQHGS